MSEHHKIAVLGGGSWATAIVKMLIENTETVGWYMRSAPAIAYLKENHHNPKYLRSAELDPKHLDLSNDINYMITNYSVLIFAIPSAFLTSELDKLNESLENKTIFSAIKGIVPETGLIVGEHFHKKYNIPLENIGVITGPCHAEEVAMERLSYLTIACQDENKAKIMADSLNSWYINTKISDDIIGTEYAAVLKNIYAIAAGIAHGLGYGDNFQAVLMSNAIREMKRFIKKVHKMKRNINDSAYLGDLLVTGYSTFSRNRQFGNMIGKGYTVKSAQLEMSMIAEGYYATKSAFNIKEEKGTKTPIIDAVYNVLYAERDPKKEFKKLTNKLD
ncbi:MAG: NAD(P)H-dependent glycerol-3-phosphate dehydrogenase [Polaribacter sp.]|jgi:glycerol-3-phosphate dehydrogenase (NAD(P)+)|uniref:NAD(P)H-dependent glycerol-3-phosphate dehydrogenase n=1 Tax=Polaribacter sp. TaxID=1920175 RepID=UPI002613A232|nr:NAD(P)H-dependent glycerol-3-phosphate dehydrogenase [Polaribacter sp.]MBT3741352.1 NAD(P)H-dependent glycerol-3-phosphate dehydrogenase [Polaribacter sp.]MBT4414314.1 NAD(P)H-dependent glycerol-3-phosphate dehydrogenase [Polaribacter sp.]MBT7816101.1 NAD(P)H-dependent glycerol-3-phosphate dehydrogenase [Polaribacter sp.]MDG1194449.1 NAD(P)H-dependent glycerol-3-phosphate dehydrogenase [Polaribacter sp.]MDG1402337.1 NAD(P)H-dependent glycerol-3-phosphate dehydrogenase [Polaribacter sp.]